MDLWTTIDILCSFLNIVCFQVIGAVTPDKVVIVTERQKLDYYVITVVIISWLRFFAYFLLIAKISKFLMTLMRML